MAPGEIAPPADVAAETTAEVAPPLDLPAVDIATFDPIVMELPCSDAIDSVYADPGALPADKGAVIRCAPDGELTPADILAELKQMDYQGNAIYSGAKVYRVLYRTERATGEAGYSSALVFLPDAPPAEKMPVVVASHGSRGQAGKCAPSVDDPAAIVVRDDFIRQVYPLVGHGMAVIAPDLAGYANYGAAGNPASGYAFAADVAKSTIDGARAMFKLAPARLTDQVMLVGHSQGGHTALSALAEAEGYGADLNFAGAAVFAPLWLSQRSWGAIFLLADSYPIAKAAGPVGVTVWYHYTHGEILDGPGHGLDPFAEDAKQAIADFVKDTCWQDSYPALEALGKTLFDVFDKTFYESIMNTAGVALPCPAADPGKTLCETWMARYAADRPHLTGKAAAVPLLLIYGAKDTTIPPERFQCALDRLVSDGTALTECFDPEGGHGDTVARQADYVSEWLLHMSVGLPVFGECPASKIVLTDDKGAAVKCASIPPND
jgi:alpha-beta hydrolase superfamily lysophospholipase